MRPAARCFCGCCKTACSAAVAAPTCCCRALTWARFSRRLRRIGYGAMAGKSSPGNGFAGCCHRLARVGRSAAAGPWPRSGLSMSPWPARHGRPAGWWAALPDWTQQASGPPAAGAPRARGGALPPSPPPLSPPPPTVYAPAAGGRLPQPMLALRSTAEQPAQFVFDRGWLGGPPGLLAFVVSASDGERAAIERQVLQQARSTLTHRESGAQPPLRLVQTVLEKRATFACTPGLQRPGMQVLPGLSACGDYVQGPYPVYPATLEGAVLSGSAAAAQARPSTAWR